MKVFGGLLNSLSVSGAAAAAIGNTAPCTIDLTGVTQDQIDQYFTCLDEMPVAEMQMHVEQLSTELKASTGVSLHDLNTMTDAQLDDYVTRLAEQ